jgi:hypothetical protein
VTWTFTFEEAVIGLALKDRDAMATERAAAVFAIGAIKSVVVSALMV